LERAVSLVVIDTVTGRQANLHTEIAQTLEAAAELAWEPSSRLYAVAYRTVSVNGATRVEAWPETLVIGEELPTLPLWLAVDLCLPLPLEASYSAACHSLRIAR
jgi:hypothetical protein